MIQQKQEELLQLYREWKSELEKICPQFMCNDFSHPYYLHIPDVWYERKCRILVVGKEGYGNHHQFDSSIENVQEFNREYLACQLGQYSKDYNSKDYNRSPFWNRIRRINRLPKSNEISITWTNIDKIHRIGAHCPLLKKQRYELHQTEKKILAEEIKLLQPNIVIFFGWYDVSLEEELPVVYKRLHDADYQSFWNENRMKTISEGGVSYVFTNHPGWGQRQKGYEEKVVSEVNRIICEILAK